jgi:hypothetical protein
MNAHSNNDFLHSDLLAARAKLREAPATGFLASWQQAREMQDACHFLQRRGDAIDVTTADQLEPRIEARLHLLDAQLGGLIWGVMGAAGTVLLLNFGIPVMLGIIKLGGWAVGAVLTALGA